MSKCVVWVVETYNSGEFHFGCVYPPRSVGRQQREMISPGMVTVDPYHPAPVSHCTRSVSAKPIDLCVLMCEDRMGRGESK